MMKVKTFVVGPLQQNTYVVSDDSGEAVMVDCGALFEGEELEIAQYIKDEGLTLRHLLLTHAHFDHACGVPFVWHVFGVAAELSDADLWLYNTMAEQVMQFLRRKITFDMPMPGGYLREGGTVTFGHHTLDIISVPGHTPGGLAFYCKGENVLFSGDNLFRSSIGRTDFERSDTAALLTALRDKVMTLPSETVVYPGHGLQTTIGDELTCNPYL